MFCVSAEMRSRINGALDRPQSHGIGVSDVLIWAIHETHADLRRLMPLWAVQGRRHDRQKWIWDATKCSTGMQMTQEQAAEFLEEEALTLKHRYRPSVRANMDNPSLFENIGEEERTSTINAIQAQCREFGLNHIKSAALEEQQERELAPESEQERQVERPQAAEPKDHSIHAHVHAFIATGVIPTSSPAFQKCYSVFENTTLASLLNLEQMPNNLLVTADFAETVKLPKRDGCADAYQRPVQWVLTSKDNGGTVRHMVVISPYEAQELMPRIRQSERLHLHLYSPQTNLAFKTLDQLRLFVVPATGVEWQLPTFLRLQLNIFAGQLYFGSLDDYQQCCTMLCLAWKPPGDCDVVEADGFMPASAGAEVTLERSPVSFIWSLFTRIRRDCQDINRTHWGRVLAGELLNYIDFPMQAAALPIRPRHQL